jgi:trimeric autotransporter adhesin
MANKVATADDGVQVFFGSVAAPLLYVSATQINMIVPYEVAGTRTSVSLQYNGSSIPAGSYVVTASAPAIFTLSSTGQGPAAVLNQDESINSATNPAARGSIVQIYATGSGATQPSSVTGSVTSGAITQPTLPVSVTIGGVSATVTSAAEAPGEVSGVLQVNAVVPQNLTPGSSVPIVIAVGSVPSQSGAVIAIK